jgi:SAM-dependent methyltransferase
VIHGVGFDASTRRREPELMDGLGLDRALHEHALDALGRVNRVSLTSARAWREVERIRQSDGEPVRVLDVACGGGDVLIDIARRARSRGVAVELLGCDLSPVALERARTRADGDRGDTEPAAGRATIRFEQRDVLEAPLAGGHHLVLCSLFLHHLSHGDAVRLLRSLAAASERVLLVQDLRRTRVGYALAWLGLHLLTGSVVARRDGPVSVQAAFTLGEAQALARDAGLAGAEVRPCWPQRFTLRWIRA